MSPKMQLIFTREAEFEENETTYAAPMVVYGTQDM
jgi:hypothetical protein